MLKLEENNRLPDLDRFCMSGELAPSGQLRSINGVLSIALEASIRACKTAMSDYIPSGRDWGWLFQAEPLRKRSRPVICAVGRARFSVRGGLSMDSDLRRLLGVGDGRPCLPDQRSHPVQGAGVCSACRDSGPLPQP